MINTVRKIALQITIPVLCGLIALNAYLVSRNLKLIQKNAAQRVEASEMQADISHVMFDLQDMETGQRGYLLTGDPAYRQPYDQAKERLVVHIATLRSRLAGKAPQERSMETRLESLAEAKSAEMEETIRLREQGYRHRAFLIVGSNRGKELMDQARSASTALSSEESSNVARYDRELRESVGRAVKESILASSLLLAVTLGAFLGFNRHRRRLEIVYARQAEELRAASLQLERLTAIVFNDFRALATELRSHANTLLEVYGGYLPRQGQAKAECIEDGAGQMNRLLDDLSRNSLPANAAAVVDHPPSEQAERLIAAQ